MIRAYLHRISTTVEQRERFVTAVVLGLFIGFVAHFGGHVLLGVALVTGPIYGICAAMFLAWRWISRGE